MTDSKEKVINGKALWTKVKWVYYVIQPIIVILLIAFATIIINRYFFNAGKINHTLILRYCQVLEWPIVILLVYFLFRPYLPDIVSRIEGIWGIRVKPKQAFQPDTGTGIAKEVTEVPKTSAPQADITTIKGRADLIQGNPEIRWLLEKSYRFAYGTQIQALNLLQSSGPLKVEDLQFLYDKHVRLSNVPHPNVATWLLYLKKDVFITEEESNGAISITDIGRLFLEYLATEGISDPSLRNY